MQQIGCRAMRWLVSTLRGMLHDNWLLMLQNMFAEGQCYVALSRVRSMEGLQILDSNPDCVKVRAGLPPHLSPDTTSQGPSIRTVARLRPLTALSDASIVICSPTLNLQSRHQLDGCQSRCACKAPLTHAHMQPGTCPTDLRMNVSQPELFQSLMCFDEMGRIGPGTS